MCLVAHGLPDSEERSEAAVNTTSDSFRIGLCAFSVSSPPTVAKGRPQKVRAMAGKQKESSAERGPRRKAVFFDGEVFARDLAVTQTGAISGGVPRLQSAR